MSFASRLIRLFVSSTFRDMHAERDYLNRFVFRELRSRCRQHETEFTAIDLRWGVTAEDVWQHGTLEVCLQEVDRCRPFFLALIGERYGWVPPPDNIPAPFYSNVLRDGALVSEQAELLNQWYVLDETLQRPVYRLRRESQPSSETVEALIAVWDQAGLPHAGDSITAREIQYGVLTPGVEGRRLIYLRTPPVHTDPLFPAAYLPAFAELLRSRQARLLALKAKLTEALGSAAKEYRVRFSGLRIDPTWLPAPSPAIRAAFEDGVFRPGEWTGLRPELQAVLREHGTVALDGLEEWGAQVLEDLWALIQAELRGSVARQPVVDPERVYHERFLIERTELFVGRTGELDRLLIYAGDDADRKPFVVTGTAGTGKSALVAEFARRCRRQFPEAFVLSYFIGAAPGSKIPSEMLRSICEILRRECNLASEIPSGWDELSNAVRSFLENAGAQRQVILLIDGLNQLEQVPGRNTWNWLPITLPPGVRLIATTLPGPALDRFQEILPEDHLLDLPELPIDDRRALIEGRLQRRGKKLAEYEISRLLDTKARPDSRLPLYLVVALEELAYFGEYEALDARIDRLPARLPELFDQVLARLEADHGRQPTERILGWLGVSRSGLLESEILDLLAEDAPHFPRLRWIQLYRALEFYLHQRDESGGESLLDFYHDQLRSAVYARYFGMADADEPPTVPYVAAHRRLAVYFRSVCWDSGKLPKWRVDRPRGLSELPFHLAGSGQTNPLRITLTDFGFLQARLETSDPQALIEDFDLALTPRRLRPDAARKPRNEGLRLIQAVVRLAAHVVSQDPAQLAGQLLGRLHGRTADIRRLRARAEVRHGTAWLRPVAGRLQSPRGALLRTLAGHTDSVGRVVVLSSGKQAISSSSDGNLKIWDLESGTELRTLPGHKHGIGAIAVFPDELRAIAASWDNSLMIWDLESGQVVHTLPTQDEQTLEIKLLDGGRKAICGNWEKTIKVWDLETDRVLFGLEGHANTVYHLALLANDRQLISAGGDRTVRVWDLEDRRELYNLTGHYDTVSGLAVIDRGRKAVSTSFDSTLKIWDLEKRELVRSARSVERLMCLAVSSDERCAVSGTDGGGVIVWDLDTLEPVRKMKGHRYSTNSVAFLPGDRRVISTGGDKTLKIWDLASEGRDLKQIGHKSYVHDVVVSANGKLAISGGADHTLKVWDLTSGRSIRTLRHPDRVRAVKVVANDRKAVSAGHDLRVWDLKSYKCVLKLSGHRFPIVLLAVSPDGRRAATASTKEHNIWVWDLENRRKRGELKGHNRTVSAIAFTPSGDRLISGSIDNRLIVWDVTGCQELDNLSQSWVQALAVYQDGTRALAASNGKEVCVWNLETGWQEHYFEGLSGLEDAASVLAVAPSEGHAVTGHKDGTIRVWDLTEGSALKTLTGHTEEVTSISWLGVTPRIVSVSRDFCLKCWDIQTGACVATFTTEDTLTACAASSDGRTVVAGDESGNVFILRLEGQ